MDVETGDGEIRSGGEMGTGGAMQGCGCSSLYANKIFRGVVKTQRLARACAFGTHLRAECRISWSLKSIFGFS